jgi:hypothetical protein
VYLYPCGLLCGFYPAGGCQEVDDDPSYHWLFPVRLQDVNIENHDQTARGFGDGQVEDVVPNRDENEEWDAEEAVAVKPARDPKSPSRAELLNHQATNLPFRSWCAKCVAGRSDNPGNRKVAPEERSVPEISMDYAFIRRECEADNATILVVKDLESLAVQATVLRTNEASLEEAGEKATEAIARFRHTAGKLMIKCDNENAISDPGN